MKNDITIRLAANVLYKNISNIAINYSNSSLYDIIVIDNDSGLRFGVVVGGIDYEKSEEFKNYLSRLKAENFERDINRLPIVLMVVNFESEEAYMSIIASWSFLHGITIYDKSTFIPLKPNNWKMVIDSLKKMDSVIRMLDNDDLRVKKEISLSTGSQYREEFWGKIIYLRKFTKKYRITHKHIETERESFEKIVHGILEEEYPSDYLDNIILRAVSDSYKATSKSSLFMLNTDFQELRNEISTKIIIKAQLLIAPDLSDINFNGRIPSSFNQLVVPLHIYVTSRKNQGAFSPSYNQTIPLQDWLNKYQELSNLKTTYSTPESMIK